MLIYNVHVFDFEVFQHDWIAVFRDKSSKNTEVFHNDNEGVKAYIETFRPILCGFNNKHYDQFILKAVLMGCSPEEIKEVNDLIIMKGMNGWDIPLLKGSSIYVDQYDLMDDCQQGLSLKSIEAHLGMNIVESSVDFNIDHRLSVKELDEAIHYCNYDVRATSILDDLRTPFLENKIAIGRQIGLSPAKALSMTNAKLTAVFLGAKAQERNDEREYEYPDTLDKKFIPNKVFQFFDRLKDKTIPLEEVLGEGQTLNLGPCEIKVGWGGIHGAIPNYVVRDEGQSGKVLRNYDVGSYYPHLMTIYGYTSRNIPAPDRFKEVLDQRMAAKEAGDTSTANALKLVLNTTYGASLSPYNALYDPRMGRAVCISGQLFLLELATRLHAEIPELNVVQINTDGIMVEFDDSHEKEVMMILDEWQRRTGFELEEDQIAALAQKDVNNYVMNTPDGKIKSKGGVVTRGVVTNGKIAFTRLGVPLEWANLKGGAFNINNNAVVIANAVVDCLMAGTPVEETIAGDNEPLHFQLIAKASHKYSAVYHEYDGEMMEVQRVNRIYASKNWKDGTLFKRHAETGQLMKVPGLPMNCFIDNANLCTIDLINKDWYVAQAQAYVRDFQGDAISIDRRKLSRVKKAIFKLIEKEGVANGKEE